MKNRLVLSTAGLVLCMGAITLPSNTAQAQQEMGSMRYYAIPAAEVRNHYHEWAVFLEYHLQREPCQNYQKPPAGYEVRGCHIYSTATPVAQVEPQAGSPTPAVAQVEPQAGAPTSFYTIYFDFDKSNIRDSEKGKLDEIARKIQSSQPTEVTISGYTDRSGTTWYNQALSERRTQAVVQALSAYDIQVKSTDQMSYGETNSAVPSADGVRLQENRRAVVYFNQ